MTIYQTILAESALPNCISKILSIKLNNFIHRIDCKTTMVELITQHGCSLKRIRRSKNWLLTGNHHQLLSVSGKLQQKNELWIAQAITNGLPRPTYDLTRIIKSTPDMTINRLMSETGCSLLEARTAIDAAEGFTQ